MKSFDTPMSPINFILISSYCLSVRHTHIYHIHCSYSMANLKHTQILISRPEWINSVINTWIHKIANTPNCNLVAFLFIYMIYSLEYYIIDMKAINHNHIHILRSRLWQNKTIYFVLSESTTPLFHCRVRH